MSTTACNAFSNTSLSTGQTFPVIDGNGHWAYPTSHFTPSVFIPLYTGEGSFAFLQRGSGVAANNIFVQPSDLPQSVGKSVFIFSQLNPQAQLPGTQRDNIRIMAGVAPPQLPGMAYGSFVEYNDKMYLLATSCFAVNFNGGTVNKSYSAVYVQDDNSGSAPLDSAITSPVPNGRLFAGFTQISRAVIGEITPNSIVTTLIFASRHQILFAIRNNGGTSSYSAFSPNPVVDNLLVVETGLSDIRELRFGPMAFVGNNSSLTPHESLLHGGFTHFDLGTMERPVIDVTPVLVSNSKYDSYYRQTFYPVARTIVNGAPNRVSSRIFRLFRLQLAGLKTTTFNRSQRLFLRLTTGQAGLIYDDGMDIHYIPPKSSKVINLRHVDTCLLSSWSDSFTVEIYGGR